MPFRHTDGDLLSESPLGLPTDPQSPPDSYSLDSHTHKTIINELRRSSGTGSVGSGSGGSGSSDAELLVSMAQRLGQVERELLTSKREIIEKVRTDFFTWLHYGQCTHIG